MKTSSRNGRNTSRRHCGSWEPVILRQPRYIHNHTASHLQEVLIENVAQVVTRFLSRLFQRRACRPETKELICTRLTPYFSVRHPTRGAIPGPFFKLPTAHRKLILDVLAMMLYDQDVKPGMGEFLGTLERSLTGQDEKGYWNQISQRRVIGSGAGY